MQLRVFKCTPSHLSQAIRTRPHLPKPRVSSLASELGLCHVGFVPFSKVSYFLVTGLSLHMLFPLFRGFFLFSSPPRMHSFHLDSTCSPADVNSRAAFSGSFPSPCDFVSGSHFHALISVWVHSFLEGDWGRVSTSLNKLRSLRAAAV